MCIRYYLLCNYIIIIPYYYYTVVERFTVLPYDFSVVFLFFGLDLLE